MSFDRKIFVLLIIFFASLSSLAEKISSINITGIDKISRGTVLNYIPYEIGDTFDPTSSGEVIRSLYKTNFFKDISVSFNDSVLNISLLENPSIKYLEFKNYSDGNVLSQELIEKILKNNNLEVGDIYNDKTLDSLIKEINGLYINNGYYNTDISKKIDLDSQNRIGIEIFIEENNVALIKEFKISGSKVFDQDALLELFDIGEPDFFLINYFTEKDRYNQSVFNAGIEKMRSLYIANGYLDFKIISQNIKISDNKEKITINLSVSEGEQYKFGSIIFDGDLLDFSQEFLIKKLDVQSSKFFDREKLIKGVKAVEKIYSNLGYAFVKINTILDKVPNSYELQATVTIDTDSRIYVDRIIINGNNRTQDNVIRREFLINEGQVFSDSLYQESIKRIRRIGYFSDVKSDIVRSGDNSDKVNILINVTETKTGEFSVGLSHSNSTGASFNTGIQEKNFLGTGNTLNAKFNNSKAVEELSVYFLDPHFNTEEHSISYGFYTKKLDAANLDISSYILNENGLIFGYGIPLTESSDLRMESNISSIDIKCGLIFSSSAYESSQCSSSDSNEVAVTLSYDKNTLNDFNFPTEGTKKDYSLKFASPLGDFQYLSAEASTKDYFPISSSLTYKLQNKIGFASGFGNKELPFFKRFYGGGNSSVRGFSFNSLGEKYPDGKSKGGEVNFLSSSSIISPLKISNTENLRIAGFIDSGGVSNKMENLSMSDIRVSTGVAINWLTPIGPIGIHLAKPLLKKSGDVTETFAFSIGSTF